MITDVAAFWKIKKKFPQLFICLMTFSFILFTSPEEEVHTSVSDPALQQPPCYQEEEEEIYISEPMQEITDGTLVFWL